MGRAPCCDKASVKKGPWSPEEDAKLKSYIEQHGTGGNWIALPQKIGLKRCGKSCRLRWLNYLRPNIKHGGFSEEEDMIICSLYISIGSRWSIIAAQLPGRTDNDIKNYWNTRLKKKLLGKQRKDQQQARRLCGPKHHEIKKPESNNGNCMQVSGDCYQSLHWPDQPPVPVFSNQDHTSMRKLLVKIGGRFYGDDMTVKDQSPLALPSSALHIYENNPINLVSSSSASFNPFNESSSSSLGTQMFPTELEEMIYSNAMKLEGSDCLYGVGNNLVNDSNGTTSSSESMSWNIDMSPLVYPPLALDYHGMVLQPCLLEELTVHLEAQ